MDELSKDLSRASRFYVMAVSAALLMRLFLEPSAISLAPALLAVLVLMLLMLVVLNGTPPTWQAGGLFVLGINGGYQAVGRFMHEAGGWRADPLLLQTDRFLLGGMDVQTHLSALNQPWINDVLALSYAFFLVLLPLVSIYYIFSGRPDARGRFWLGLMTVYGLGFAGYLLLPAAGPYQFDPQALPVLSHGFVSAPIYAFIANHSTGVDVWPSLHCAVTVYIQFWLWREAPKYGQVLLPISFLVVLSTMALQFHYFIDVLCGLALAAMSARIALRKG